jgi:iron(III) transport system ATP-binding protein
MPPLQTSAAKEHGAFVRTEHVAIKYDDREILRDTNFSLSRGELVCILGPSGCGKTSLLRVVCGLERPKEGQVEVGGRTAQKALQDGLISVAFQEATLLPWLTWVGNAGWFAKMRQGRFPRDEVTNLARAFGLDDLPRNKMPNSLSGGQAQRVALIRALTMKAPFVVLDEPFSALDYTRRKSIIAEIRRRLRASNSTAILVTHDVRDAVHFADRLLIYHEQDRSFTRHFTIKLDVSREAALRDTREFNSIASQVHQLLDG